jgi:hypothetical protein
MMLLACSLSAAAPATTDTPTRVPLLPTTASTAKPTRPPVGATALPTKTPLSEVSATEAPLATLDAGTSVSDAEFADDFSDLNSGWDSYANEHGSAGYTDGQYMIKVDDVEYSLWANPSQEFGDVLVGVTVQPTANSAIADMGPLCRYQDVDNFVYGSITSDGYYGITQMKNGDFTILSGGGKLQPNDTIRQGSKANQVQLLCAGNNFALFVNDQFIDAVQAEAPARGDVGLIAGTFEKGGAQVRFDDFSAVPPPPGTEIGPVGEQPLFADDFSDPQSGWDVRKTENGASGYRNGRYFIRVEKPKFQLWSTAGQEFADDVIVTVSAGPSAGPAENEMGVICRYQDSDNFIYGSVGSDGFYAIVEEVKGETTILTDGGKFQQSDAIPVDSEAYFIQLACVGDQYTLSVNGIAIDTATSTTFTGGDVGLLAGTFDEGGVEILFDDFSVSEP